MAPRDQPEKSPLRWEEIKLLGEGAQGEVHLVRDTEKCWSAEQIATKFDECISGLAKKAPRDLDQQRLAALGAFTDILSSLQAREFAANLGARKTLHEGAKARDDKRSRDRIQQEIRAMKNSSHPNLLKILDASVEDFWYVSEYHPNDHLHSDANRKRYAGNLAATLRDIRPLVEGVARLHDDKIIHRDIKPKNIFIASDERLVLGDFGLVFFQDSEHTRLSDTIGNVGSRDWMPGWAYSLKAEEVEEEFDVFALGKVIWSMVSGQPVCPLWYYDNEQSNVENLYPNDPYMKFANLLFRKCIVEHKKNSLPGAWALLEEIDRILIKIQRNSEIIGAGIQRRCTVCGDGFYILQAEPNSVNIKNLGFNPAGGFSFAFFSCNYCGHIQWFLHDPEFPSPAW